MLIIVFLASYLAVFMFVCSRAAAATAQLRDQLERLEWPPAEALEFIHRRRRKAELAFQTLRYGTAISFAVFVTGSLIA